MPTMNMKAGRRESVTPTSARYSCAASRRDNGDEDAQADRREEQDGGKRGGARRGRARDRWMTEARRGHFAPMTAGVEVMPP